MTRKPWKCLKRFPRHAASAASLDDSTLLKHMKNTSDWYQHDDNEHRYYMRLLKQEAHRRGLTLGS